MDPYKIIAKLIRTGIEQMFDAANENISRKQYIIENMQKAMVNFINTTAGNERSVRGVLNFHLNKIIARIQEDLDTTDERIIAIAIGGAFMSSLGYALMWLTAALFPAWRKSEHNRLWLQMCAANLLAIYSFLWGWLIFDGRIGGPDNVHIATTYLLQVTLWFLLCGALLTHGRLVDVFATRSRFLLKSSLISWLTPVPFSLVAYFSYTSRRELPKLRNRGRAVLVRMGHRELDVTRYPDLLLLVYGAAALMPFVLLSVGCALVYTRVLYRVWRDTQQRWSVAGRVSLAVLFLLTSGVQCAVSLCHTFFGSTPDAITFAAAVLLSFDVFVYSVLLLVANKRTRELWVAWFVNIATKYWN